MVGLERPQGQPRIFTHPANVNEPSMYDPEITVEAEDAVQADMGGDKCCEEARMKFREVLRKHFGKASWDDIEIIIEQPCEKLQKELEEWLAQPWVADRTRAADGFTLVEDLTRVQNEWDACSSESFGGMFTASEDAFEAGWNAIQKQIGRDDFTYNMWYQPHLMADAGPFQREIPPELGIETLGRIPITSAIQHLEQLEQDPTEFATRLGYETPESVGLRRDDYDDDDEWWEALAEQGISSSPEEFLGHKEIPLHVVQMLFDNAKQYAGRMPLPNELRNRLENYSFYYPQMVQYGGGVPNYLAYADELREKGQTTMPVTSGKISALGQGPMIDVNPLFRGMGLGLNTMASLLENTGRIEEALASPAGLASMRALDRGLREMGINPNTNITVNNMMPNEQQRAEQWHYAPEARYPVRGQMSMSVPKGTQINPVMPNRARPVTMTQEMADDGIEQFNMDQMRELVERAKGAINARQIRDSIMPPNLRGQPFIQPRIFDEDFELEGL